MTARGESRMDRNIINRAAIKCSLIVLSTIISFSIDYSQSLWIVAIISTISGLLGAASYLMFSEVSNVFLLVRPFIMVTIVLPWIWFCGDKNISWIYLIIDRGFLGAATALNVIAITSTIISTANMLIYFF